MTCISVQKYMKVVSMSSRKVRIGIDVGGTFTDACIIDNDSYELIGQIKVPTTHSAEKGVAQGIIDAIQQLMTKHAIQPEDVVFIAHGTTQATNALLEGDVARVGIIGMGSGLEAARARSETHIGDIELAESKYIHSCYRFIDVGSFDDSEQDDQAEHTSPASESALSDAKSLHAAIERALTELQTEGAQVVVASESYSVDNPLHENMVLNSCIARNIPATCGHELSQLYGLGARTRTAVVNAALIPKMIETANVTEDAVVHSRIKSPLMIMRCDGGVMSADEVRKRPILTMLSGLAAGVAGALMYEKITDGIFLEAGGTSTDISAIKDGKVMIKNAQVGGHKLYITSLDVRTLAVAGGSMIVVQNNKIADVGPRSAHIAGLAYEVFPDVAQEVTSFEGAKVEYIAPLPEDTPHYASVVLPNNTRVALTLAGAANVCGYVPEGDYAHGDAAAALKAWEIFGKSLGMEGTEAAREVVAIACKKIEAIVSSLIADYHLNPQLIHLVGGGGSASVVVNALGEHMHIASKIARNAPYISTIGVGLALVREQIERNVANPSEQDIKKIRHDALQAVVKAGAHASTVEITIEVDAQKNILRAIATGATELRKKESLAAEKSEAELQGIIAKSASTTPDKVQCRGRAGRFLAFSCTCAKKSFFNLITRHEELLRVIDTEGVIRLQKHNAQVLCCKKSELDSQFPSFVDAYTTYSDAGCVLPKIYLFFEQSFRDLSGMLKKDQLTSLMSMELEFLADDDFVIVAAVKD